MKIFSLVLVLLFSTFAEAQNEINALRLYVGVTGSTCVVRSGTGVPATSLGAVCDTYLRKDSPYTIYVKSGASTWSEIYRQGGTDVAVADGGTGLSSYTTGDLLYASGATTLAGRAAVATGQVMTSAGTSTAPVWSATPSLTSIGGAANLTLNPTGDVILGPTGVETLPNTGYTQNIGSLTNKFLTLHAAELWVENLVAQNTIATIGGRVLVGPTTTLTSDISSGSTTILTKHNNLVNNDTVYMEANGKVEFMLVTSGASGGGPYTYNVTRDLDGTGANAWTAGDAIFNTGGVDSGFMDQYSYNSFTPAGLQYIFNFNNTGSAFSANYADESTYPTFALLGDGANTEVNDAIYFGGPAAWFTLSSNVITPVSLGGGTTIVFEFWNGSAWTALTGTSGTGFGAVGPGGFAWTNPQTGWVANTVNSVSAFWMRIRINAFSGATTAGSWRTARRGTQGWGPTIVGNVRTAVGSTTNFNAWSPRWAIGNLNGTYGYGSNTYGAAFGNNSATWIKIDDANGLRMGNAGVTSVQITPAGAASFTGTVTAAAGSFTGTVTASAGSIGGWTINSGYLSAGSGATTVGLSPGDYPFWSGNTYANRATAPFRVTNAGAIFATNATITGGSLSIGNTTIDTNGVSIVMSATEATIATSNAVRFTAPDGGTSWVGGGYDTSGKTIYIQAENDSNGDFGRLKLIAKGETDGGTERTSTIEISAGYQNGTDILGEYVDVLTDTVSFKSVTDPTMTAYVEGQIRLSLDVTSPGNGSISQTTVDGLTLKAVSGSTRDFTVLSTGGTAVIGISGVEIGFAGVSSDGTGKVLCVKADASIGTCDATTLNTSDCTCS